MEVSEEISYIEKLQLLSNSQITGELPPFFEILDILMTSHTYNIFCFNKQNLPILEKFSQRLRIISRLVDDKYSEGLRTYADDFSTNPDEYDWR